MKKYIFIGVFVFLLAMLVTIPASIAAKLLPNNIIASHYQGNIWNGSANSFTIDQVDLGSVKWDIQPSCFLVLKLCADIKQNNENLNSSFLLKVSGNTDLENLNVSGDASVLNAIVEKYGITLAGDFEADLAQLSLIENRIQNIDGDIRFTSLSVNGVLRVLLGDIDSVFEPQDQHTLIRISNDQGHVDLSGIVQLFDDMSFDLDMDIRHNQRSSDAVVNGLQFIGDQQSDGSVKLKKNGKLAI